MTDQKQQASEIPECPAVSKCLCYLDTSIDLCVCGLTEKALRAWVSGELPAMTPCQRLWCLNEIDSIEGYRRQDYETCTDALLANGVLSAWVDYCRDKGLM